VVKRGGAAVGFIVNTTGVELEGVVAGIDGNRGGAFGNLILEIRFAAGGNVDVASKSRTAVGGAVLAGSILSSVGVRGLGVDTVVGDDVLEGISHETTIATLVTLGTRAINQVLLGEGDEGLGVQEVSTLNGASGGERPAGTALALVLDASDGTFFPPINRGRESRDIDFNGGFGNLNVSLLQTLEKAVEFIVGEISELVHANSEGDISALVEFLNPLVVFLPDGVPGLELIGGVNFVVFPHPFGETSLEVGFVADNSANEEGEQEDSKKLGKKLTDST